MNETLRPKVGVGVLILKDEKVLIGLRKGSHGEGEYCFPGGHLEYLESIEACARRETAEEAGIEIKNLRFLCLTNLKKYAPKHYIDIGVIAEWAEGEPKTLEPHKLENWEWRPINDLPEPLFGAMHNYFEAYATGKYYFDE